MAVVTKHNVPKEYIRTKSDRKAIDEGCYWDEDAADRVIRFCETALRNYTTDKKTGKIIQIPFKFLDWQRDEVIRPLFAWKRPDGTRRFRTGSIWIPKKNGKTLILAAITWYMLVGDNEPNARCYSAATVQEQAALIYEAMMTMAGPKLKAYLQWNQNKKQITFSQHIYRALARESDFSDGISVHCCVVDELHRHKSHKMVSLMQKSMGGRKQGLCLVISTAGNDLNSVAYQEYNNAKRILDGTNIDPSYFAVVYEAPNKLDVWDDETLLLANPSARELPWLLEDLKNDRQSSFNDTTLYKEIDFRQLRLNQWVTRSLSYFDMDIWRQNDELYDVKLLAGKDCFGGLDLSMSQDMTAFVLCFEVDSLRDDCKKYVFLPFFWLPQHGIHLKEQKDRLPYQQWVKQGHLKLTPGKVIDYEIVRDDILALANKYNILDVGYDRWNSFSIVPQLSNNGVNMTECKMSPPDFSPMLMGFNSILQQEKVVHNMNPILHDMALHVVTTPTTGGFLRIDKRKCIHKIDGIVAACMAYNRLTVNDYATLENEIEIPEGKWVF